MEIQRVYSIQDTCKHFIIDYEGLCIIARDCIIAPPWIGRRCLSKRLLLYPVSQDKEVNLRARHGATPYQQIIVPNESHGTVYLVWEWVNWFLNFELHYILHLAVQMLPRKFRLLCSGQAYLVVLVLTILDRKRKKRMFRLLCTTFFYSPIDNMNHQKYSF